MSASNDPPPSANERPLLIALLALIVGLAVIVFTLLVAVCNFDTADEVAKIMAPVVGAIAAILGAFFGIHAASVAHQRALEAVKQAHDTAMTEVLRAHGGKE